MSDLMRGHLKRWCLAPARPEAEALSRSLHTSRLMGQLLAARDLVDAPSAHHHLDPKLTDLHDPALLPGTERAAQRLVDAVRAGEKIVIYGDYDVDGVCATAILYHAIKTAEPAANICTYVPHRLDEGYGLNDQAIEQLCDEGAQVIVSVDCGVTAVAPAAIAKARGVDLIITDHHEWSDEKPDAYAIVHPRLESGYPFGELCGAGVAYKIAWQIARTWCGSDRVSDTFRTLLIDLLPFAALATIADVVPLVDENRAIVVHGLKRIKQTPFEGLSALISASNLDGEQIDAYHVGFVLGPRLNACGRMGHAERAVQLLTVARGDEAQASARFLNTENEKRRRASQQIFEEAHAMIQATGGLDPAVRAYVLAHDDWHPGVVGIVCSRLVEATGRPTILLGDNNGELKGSGRSIDGFNLHEALHACAAPLLSFGGHAMAAGLSLERDQLEAFRAALTSYAAKRISADDLIPALDIDAQADIAELTTQAVVDIQRLGPFGRSNPAPRLLLRDVRLDRAATTMGQNAKHLSFMIRRDQNAMRCVAWGLGELASKLPGGTELDVVGEAKLNTFRGNTTVELIVDDLRWR